MGNVVDVGMVLVKGCCYPFAKTMHKLSIAYGQ
jgi:hypothetical protein